MLNSYSIPLFKRQKGLKYTAKKIIKASLALLLATSLFYGNVEIFATGRYNQDTKVLHFQDDVLTDQTNPSTRVEYGLVEVMHQGKKVPAVEYVFTYNPEFQELRERQLIGFVLPESVTIPTRIIKVKEYKTGEVIAEPERKEYAGGDIIVKWLANQESQDYGSKLTAINPLTKIGSVEHEAFANQKNANRQIYKFDDNFKAYILKGYQNENIDINTIEGYKELKEYLDGKANQIFASWEPVNNHNKYTFRVIALLRDPKAGGSNIVDDKDRVFDDEEVKKMDLTALAFISSKKAPTAKIYRVAGVKASVEDTRKAKNHIVDSNRKNLAEIYQLVLKDEKPVQTYVGTDFDEQQIKDKVLLPEGSKITRVDKPDHNTPGFGEATVTVEHKDASTDTIKVPTVALPNVGNKVWDEFVQKQFGEMMKKFKNPDTDLKLADKKEIEELKSVYESLLPTLDESRQRIAKGIKKDFDNLLNKIKDWEEKIKEFKDKYREFYDKKGVDIKDKEKIEEALAKFGEGDDKLHKKVQEALATEKQKLEEKLAKIKEIEAKAKEFNNANQDIKDDKNPKYSEGVDAYKKLSENEKEALKKLNPELAKLLEDGKKTQDEEQAKAKAEEFKKEHRDILNKKLEEVSQEDIEKIKKLTAAFKLLDDEVQKSLSDEDKEKIKKLEEKLTELKKTKYEFVKNDDGKIQVKITKYDEDDSGRGQVKTEIRDVIPSDGVGIKIVQEPTKKAYKVGEKFDPAGLKIKLVDKEAGESEEITHDKFEANNISLKLEGDKDITTALTKTDTKVLVKYGDKQAEVNISVTEEGVEKPSEPAPSQPAPIPQPKPSVPAPSKPNTAISPKEDNNIFRSEQKDKVENQKQNSKDKVPNTRATQTAGVMLTISLAAAFLLNKKRK